MIIYACMASASAKLHTESESMHQTLTLQDAHLNDQLKSIKKQLYSAADYFEASYINDDKRKKLVIMERLKDYTLKALVNTVDHLGSMAYNINTNFVGHMNCNIGAEITQLDLRLCCLQQRVGTCRDFAGLRGVSQQSLATDSPRHQKRYTCLLAENKFQHESGNCSASPRLNHRLNNPTRSPPSFIWEEYFVSQSPDLPLSLGPTPTYPLTTSWKSGSSSEASPNVQHHHNLIPVLPHSGSLLIKRPTSPTNCYPIKRRSRQPQRTTSLPVERGTSWEEEAEEADDHHSGKGKRLLKAMLSLRIKYSKRDDTCY